MQELGVKTTIIIGIYRLKWSKVVLIGCVGVGQPG